MAKKIKYAEAIKEIEEILGEIESNEIDVDELSTKVKRAADLIKICKEKLNKTETEIQEVLKSIQ